MNGVVLKAIQFLVGEVDHVNMMIFIVIRVTKQVRVDTDYRYFVTLWFERYIIQPAGRITKIIAAILSTSHCIEN